MLNLFGFIFIGIVIAYLLQPGVNMLFPFLLLMGMGVIIFGDIIYGFKTTRPWVKPWYEFTKPGQEIGIICTIAGGIQAVVMEKKPHGKSEFVFHRQEAAVINHGDYPLHTPNGNPAVLIHEDHDENLNACEIEYATRIREKAGTNDVKTLYHIAKQKDTELKQ